MDGKVTSGSFTIPVASIINLNLPTEELKEQLVHHLQSPDFFNMAVHPNVTFLKFDRTKFGITFASDPGLPAENYIEPLISVHLKLSGFKK